MDMLPQAALPTTRPPSIWETDFSSDPYRSLSTVYDVFGLYRFSLAATQTVLQTLAETKPGQALDLGCGTGRAVFQLASPAATCATCRPGTKPTL
jgi:hypothetical protein